MAENPLAHGPTLAAKPAAMVASSDAGPVDTGEGVAPQKLPPGTAVGDYLIDKFLGAGAMGEVYAGHHPVIGKKVAIKVLRRELAASEEHAERFTREARAVNQVDHPNVIDVFAYGRLDDGRLYLAMDLAPGTSLRARLAGGALPVADALDILAHIADALDAAHERGVVHRDLKPDNIMVAGDPFRVFVLDFGIAKLVSANGKLGNGTLTGQGTWLGTPAYMAPEQWSTDGAGPASDRYALGVIAFELLSGGLPFAASSVPGMMEQHFRAAVPALSARGAVATAVDDVVRRMLAKDPEARYPTAKQFVAELRAAAGSSAGKITAREHAKRPWLPAALGVGVLGVGVAGVIVARGGSSERPAHAAPSGEPEAGMVRLDVTSTPSGAVVVVGDHTVGTTPHTLSVKPNVAIELVVKKPGYMPSHRSLTPSELDSAVAVNLGEVTRFQGVWRLPKGVLRAFERKDDVVDVYKLDAVAGARTFYKHMQFADADTGIAFATDDEIVDERSTDASCHVPVHVEYRYDPLSDKLELRQPTVSIDIVDGHCVQRSRDVAVHALERVDGGAHEPVSHDAPVGDPTKLIKPSPPPKQAPTKTSKRGKTIPLDIKAQSVPEKPTNTYAKTKKAKQKSDAADDLTANDVGNAFDGGKQAPQQQANPPPPQQQAAPNSQILPQPQAASPTVNAEDTQQQQGQIQQQRVRK